MALTSGMRLGAYEIVDALGAGGMGEVYRARDTRLKREVALKVLPEAFAQDADRLARFRREAEMLAALNHPNIAAVYGLEESDGVTAIILELVEGETLAQKLTQVSTNKSQGSGVALDEALNIARQIADALESAHEKGVIHRDLKPANIKIAPDGTVKVLDFGLAKMLEASVSDGSGGAGRSFSPTLSIHATMAGVILGTAAYMSPEQARGKPVDRRTDIWAFGCVLFEMLTGRQTFEGGETVTDTVAAIIKNEPEWSALPPETPRHIVALLKRCLQKDPKRRLRDIGDARLELEEGPLTPSDVVATAGAGLQAGPTRRATVLAWALAAVATIVALALAAVILGHREPADLGTVRLSIAPPEGETFGHNGAQRGSGTPAPHFAPSPDGKRLAYIMYAADKPPQIWVHRLDALSGQPLPGTDDASFPFWSPDSRWIGFFAQGKLKKIDASGGAPQTICDAPAGEGGTWNRDGDIVFARDEATGLSRVSAAGGVPAAATTLDAARHESSHRWPQFLPDGRHFLYLAMAGVAARAPRASVGSDRSLYVGSLDAAAPIPILKGALRGQYASGRLLFIKDTTLMAQPFDTTQWRLTGDPVSVAEQVAWNSINGRTALGVSDGVLMYRLGASVGGAYRLGWFDRAGKRLGSVGAPADYAELQLAPDGKAVVAYIQDAATSTGDLWIVALARGGIPSRLTLTSDQAEAGSTWSPDGTRVAYATGPGGGNTTDLYAKPTNGVGDAELLLKSGLNMRATSWSPDGRYIAFNQTDPKSGLDIWLLPLAGDRPSTSSGRPEPVEGRKPVPFLQSSFAESNATFSPDGHWIAYTSDKGGSTDVYVRPFPSGDREWRVSQAGGSYPQWRGDGKELYYVDPTSNAVMAVAIKGFATLEPAPPVKLFTSTPIRAFGRNQYSVTADGQRFLMTVDSEAAERSTGQAPIVVVVNWAGALGK